MNAVCSMDHQIVLGTIINSSGQLVRMSLRAQLVLDYIVSQWLAQMHLTAIAAVKMLVNTDLAPCASSLVAAYLQGCMSLVMAPHMLSAVSARHVAPGDSIMRHGNSTLCHIVFMRKSIGHQATCICPVLPPARVLRTWGSARPGSAVAGTHFSGSLEADTSWGAGQRADSEF